MSNSVLVKYFLRALLLFRRFLLLTFTKKTAINQSENSSLPYSLVYLCHEKDIDVLERSIKITPGNIAGDLNRIILIYPSAQKENFRNRFSWLSYDEFTDEALFSKFLSPGTMSLLDTVKRQGWIKQQLLKFLAAYIVPTQKYLVVDADTVVIDRMEFEKNGKPVFYFSDELEFSYRRYIKRLLGHCSYSTLSFVSHICLFDKKQVMYMMDYIAHKRFTPVSEMEDSQDKAVMAMLSALDFDNDSILSEYELYKYFVTEVAREKIVIRYWRNKALNLLTWNGELDSYKQLYYSVSFHDYYRK